MSKDKKSPQENPNHNHYDTLGLKQSCTEKEVRDAFVILSKAHHPDLHPNDPNHQYKFMEIYEAYSTLSKPERRLVYDSNLRFLERTAQHRNMNGSKTDAPHYTAWRDDSLWNNRNKASENFDPNKPYYGIKGVNRVSNYWIAGGAVGVMLLGTFLHYIAFKHSKTFTVTQLDSKDIKIARELFRVRQIAQSNGNDTQIKLLHERFGWTEDTPKDTTEYGKKD